MLFYFGRSTHFPHRHHPPPPTLRREATITESAFGSAISAARTKPPWTYRLESPRCERAQQRTAPSFPVGPLGYSVHNFYLHHLSPTRVLTARSRKVWRMAQMARYHCTGAGGFRSFVARSLCGVWFWLWKFVRLIPLLSGNFSPKLHNPVAFFFRGEFFTFQFFTRSSSAETQLEKFPVKGMNVFRGVWQVGAQCCASIVFRVPI